MIDYASRFEFLHEGALEWVLDHGNSAFSRRAFAKYLGISDIKIRRLVAPEADLRGLAATAVCNRRRFASRGRGGRFDPAESSLQERIEQAVVVAAGALPDTPDLIPMELVGLQLSLSRPLSSEVPRSPYDHEGTIRQRMQVAERGWADPEPVPRPGALGATDKTAEHEEALDDLETLLEGITVRIVLQEITGEEGLSTARRWLTETATRIAPRMP